MSDTDSFIEEVTEEVRRDRLFGLAKRYGWIVVLGIIVLVGGAAYFEWSKSQAEAAAQSRGDAILTALEIDDGDARAAQLATLTQSEGAGVIETLLAAQDNSAETLTSLQSVAGDTNNPARVRDLAQLKLAMLDNAMEAMDKTASLEALAQPGAIYRNTATELLALHLLEQKDRDGALALMQATINDADASPSLIQRMNELIVALGATPELANAAATDSQN